MTLVIEDVFKTAANEVLNLKAVNHGASSLHPRQILASSRCRHYKHPSIIMLAFLVVWWLVASCSSSHYYNGYLAPSTQSSNIVFYVYSVAAFTVSGSVIHAIINTLRPKQNGRHFAEDIFKLIFLNENEWILIKISLKFVPKGQINNIPSLFQMMAWHRPGDKPLSEAMMVSLLTHICVTRPQWAKMQNQFHE